MTRPPQDVTIAFGGDAGPKGSYFKRLISQNGEFLRPRVLDPAVQDALQRGYSGQGTSVVVIDSGVWLRHPTIAAATDEAIDFTSTHEGPNDLNGHGTAVSLLLLAMAPRQRILSFKALDADARGRPEWMIDALSAVTNRSAQLVNLSAGVYRADCTGNCDLCTIAIKLSSSGAIVVAAAGNRPNQTACPAKGLKASCMGFAVEAFDFAEQDRAPQSGVGNIAGTTHYYDMIAAEIPLVRQPDVTGQ